MQRIEKLTKHRNRQTGGLTVFTAIMVLIILTMMIFYAARVGLFEQRVSANEVRQKVAFNAAEAAIDQGVEYLLANNQLLLSNGVAAFPDGAGGTRDGWIAANKWTACTTGFIEDPDHPCGGGSPMPEGSYFYDDPTTGYELFDVIVPAEATGVMARLTANICKLWNLDTTDTCIPLDDPPERGTFMIITLLGYGFSDCSDVTDVSTCNGKATVAKPVGNFKSLAGAPTVPLVTRSVFPPNGTAIVVPNPNAGGVGVPISAWVNNNPIDITKSEDDPDYCPQNADAVLSSGTWNTCELQEWYERENIPEGVACDQPNCSCTEEESISYKKTGIDTVIGIDIVKDAAFPCDLFHTFFNVLGDDPEYKAVKSTIPQQLSDCTTLDETSSGLFWISGGTCKLSGSTLGSPERPIVLISAASDTSITGNVTIFGLLYVFDGEDPAAGFSGAGTATIYGALIVDADMDKFTGTVNVVYSSGILLKAADLGGLGAINGGWRDFGLPDIAW